MAESLLFETALKKAMALCAGREYCRSDIRQKLSTWSIDATDAEKIISKLVIEKFIDEERYCTAFVKIASALKMKNIPGETINNALGSIDEETYMDALKEMIATQRRKVKAKNQYELKGKLLRFGLSRGFESHLLYDLLNDAE